MFKECLNNKLMSVTGCLECFLINITDISDYMECFICNTTDVLTVTWDVLFLTSLTHAHLITVGNIYRTTGFRSEEFPYICAILCEVANHVYVSYFVIH